MDNLSYSIYRQTNIEELKQIRRTNAAYIHENLSELSFLHSITENAVPLFVPVVFDNKVLRDTVRNHLISKQIYCPIHWPKSDYVPSDFSANVLYDRELSLICDQRYGVNEMKIQIEAIKQII